MACSVSRYRPWERWEIDALERIIVTERGHYEELAALTGRTVDQCYNAAQRYGIQGRGRKANEKYDWAEIDRKARDLVECQLLSIPKVADRLGVNRRMMYERFKTYDRQLRTEARRNGTRSHRNAAIRNLHANAAIRHRDDRNPQAPTRKGFSSAKDY